MKEGYSKYFGEIDYNGSAGTFLEGEFNFNEDSITLEFEIVQDLEQTEVERIDYFLDNFQENYNKIFRELRSSLDQTGHVRGYLSIIEEDFKKEMKDILKGTDSNLKRKERLFSLLYINRIEFFQKEDEFAILDFTIDEGITNDLLVVGIDRFGKVNYLTVES